MKIWNFLIKILITRIKINLKVFFHIFYLYFSWCNWKKTTLLSSIFFCFNRYLIVEYSKLHNKLFWQIAHHLPSLTCCADPTVTCHKWKTILQRIFFIYDVIFFWTHTDTGEVINNCFVRINWHTYGLNFVWNFCLVFGSIIEMFKKYK